jgi:NhaP-type Na+/H+ and K+/H+ antiporter
VTSLFATGRVVDLILGLVLIEVIALAVVRTRTKRGVNPFDLIASLLAGIALLFALRGALTGSGWPVIAVCLGAALVAHLWDLSRRWSAV